MGEFGTVKQPQMAKVLKKWHRELGNSYRVSHPMKRLQCHYYALGRGNWRQPVSRALANKRDESPFHRYMAYLL